MIRFIDSEITFVSVLRELFLLFLQFNADDVSVVQTCRLLPLDLFSQCINCQVSFSLETFPPQKIKDTCWLMVAGFKIQWDHLACEAPDACSGVLSKSKPIIATIIYAASPVSFVMDRCRLECPLLVAMFRGLVLASLWFQTGPKPSRLSLRGAKMVRMVFLGTGSKKLGSNGDHEFDAEFILQLYIKNEIFAFFLAIAIMRLGADRR